MRYLSIPYTFDNQILDKLTVENLRHVGEIYMPIPFSIAGSARIIPQELANEYDSIMVDKMKQAKELGLNVSIVCNTIIDARKYMSVEIKLIKFLEANKGLVDKLVIADMVLLSRCSSYFVENGIGVELSVVDNISTVYGVESILKSYDCVTGICLGSAFIHNLDDIKYLKSKHPGINFKLMVNHGCVVDCPSYLQHHMNHSAVIKRNEDLVSDPAEYTYNHEILVRSNVCRTCTAMHDNGTPVSKGSYILPGDISLYMTCVSQFKIVGRDEPSERIIDVINYYCSQVYEDDMFDLIGTTYPFERKKLLCSTLPSDFGMKRSNCEHKCHKCNYCDAIYNRFATDIDL